MSTSLLPPTTLDKGSTVALPSVRIQEDHSKERDLSKFYFTYDYENG